MLQFDVVRAAGVVVSTTVTYLIPVVSVALGVLVLGEHLGPSDLRFRGRPGGRLGHQRQTAGCGGLRGTLTAQAAEHHAQPTAQADGPGRKQHWRNSQARRC